MTQAVAPEFAALLEAERYGDAFDAAEAALERLDSGAAATAGDNEARLRRAFDLHFVAIRAAQALGRDEMRRHAFAALRCATDLDDEALLVRAHNAVAVAYGVAGLHAQAIEHLWTVVHVREASGSEVEPQELNNLALVYLELQRHHEAAALFRRAVDGFRAQGEPVNAALALVNLALAQRDAGHLTSAIELLNDALTTFEQHGLQLHAVSTLAHLGLAQAAAGRPERARASFDQSLSLIVQGAGRHVEPWVRVAAGRVALERADAATALEHFERVLEIVPEGHDLHRLGVLPLVADALAASDRPAEAFSTLKRHVIELERAERQAVLTAAQVRLLELEYGASGDQAIARLRAVELERVNAALGRRAAELEHISRTDVLTQLPNRRAFDERLHEALAAAQRHGRPVVLALVDFDRFKAINDRYGHHVGDAVLVRAAASMRAALRASDVLARWGGEEFALLLPDTKPSEARGVLERVRDAIRSADWGDVGLALAPTVSVGAAALVEVEDGGALLRLADRRLFAAKDAGRDRIVVGGASDD